MFVKCFHFGLKEEYGLIYIFQIFFYLYLNAGLFWLERLKIFFTCL